MSYKKERDSLKDALDELQDEFNALQEQFDQLQVDMEEEANSSGKLEDELKSRISNLEADLHAMRHSRDVLMSWVKSVTEEEYSWPAIRISGLRVIKDSLEEEERSKLHRGEL